MGNLGRAGYGASLDGLWPYTYDACDVGTLPNQTLNGLPAAATVNGDPSRDGVLSYLPGQRLSRCTCEGESHPGPKHSDGTFVGRAAPEIDIFEAQVRPSVRSPINLSRYSQNTGQPILGRVSQSAQWAVSALEHMPSQPAHASPAIQSRIHLGEYDRQHVHRRLRSILSQRLRWERHTTGHFCRNANKSRLLRRWHRVFLGLWLRIRAWIR